MFAALDLLLSVSYFLLPWISFSYSAKIVYVGQSQSLTCYEQILLFVACLSWPCSTLTPWPHSCLFTCHVVSKIQPRVIANNIEDKVLDRCSFFWTFTCLDLDLDHVERYLHDPVLAYFLDSMCLKHYLELQKNKLSTFIRVFYILTTISLVSFRFGPIFHTIKQQGAKYPNQNFWWYSSMVFV